MNVIAALFLHIRIEIDNRRTKKKQKKASRLSKVIESRMRHIQAKKKPQNSKQIPMPTAAKKAAATTSLNDIKIILVEPLPGPEVSNLDWSLQPEVDIKKKATHIVQRNHGSRSLIRKHGYSIKVIRMGLSVSLLMIVLVMIMFLNLSGDRSKRLLIYGLIITTIVDIVIPLIIIFRNDSLARLFVCLFWANLHSQKGSSYDVGTHKLSLAMIPLEKM